jgi:DMSO/TMAO reductase YedYZ molybdopterin-dependent catalytic subunit
MAVSYIIKPMHNQSWRGRNMRKALSGKGVLLAVLSLVLVAAAAFWIDSGRRQTGGLASVEVREYEGVDLSSINAFRENSITGPQQIDVESYTLSITGLVANSTRYTYDEVLSRYQQYKKVVTLDCVEGWSVTILWEGVLVKDLLAEAGPLENAKVLIFHAYDGYTTSLPVDYIMDNNILMAYKMNDVILPPERGFPFQLVAESKWGYKWIKWITAIELSDDAGYRGYWESRGYSNSGDLDEGFFGD